MKMEMDKPGRTVLISEVHPYQPFARYGGHQYARVFARYGWKVILLTSTFNVLRLLLSRKGIASEYVELWRAQGKRIDDHITNYCLAHVLPTQVRYARAFSPFAHYLYIPSLTKLLDWEGLEKVDLLWLHGNGDWLYRNAVPHTKLIVRIIDNHVESEAGYGLHPLMKRTLAEADGVFACSHYVRDLYRGIRDDMMVIPNGVDLEHFSQPISSEPELLQWIPRPRVVYAGAVSWWFDFELLCQVASRLPNLNFMIVGSWKRQQPSVGTYPQNIHIIGPLPYDSIPALLAYSDVGIVPFKNNPLVRGVSPIKVYEYLAAGLPVVSLRWRELEVEALPISLAEGATEFVQAIETALRSTSEQRSKLKEYARGCSWEQRLRTILQHIGVQLESC